MGVVKHQSVRSTILIYLGFAIGGINTLFLFPHFFSDDQFALTRMFLDIGVILVPFCTLSVGPTMNKFYPYYTARLDDKKNDMLTWVVVATLVGFLLFVLGTFIFKGLIIRKYSKNAPMFLEYFYLLYPFMLCYALFSVIENYSWTKHETVVPNFLKELVVRLGTTLLIVLYLFKLISFDLFLWLFILIWGVVLIVLLGYLKKKQLLHFNFQVSGVTRKLFRPMSTYSLSLLGATTCTLLAQNIAPLIISSTEGLKNAAYLSIATYMATLIQVPQRSISAIALPVLAQAWVDKNMDKIAEIYQKSSLLQLVAALYIFLGIWLNIDCFFMLLPPVYSIGKYVFLYMGISKVIDLGTGVNAQLLSTSRLWRFDLVSSVILMILSIPLNYMLMRTYGLVGSGYAALLSMFVFNTIRFLFIWKRFHLQPFTMNTVKAIGVAIAAYWGGGWLPYLGNPIIDIMGRALLFSGIFIFGILALRVSEDISSTAYAFLNKIRSRK
ncbi:O-antigen/teichoic acid export membrane protein [Chitinophaga niastensis]|uniref:O-antigen/teichoic acid export membrane protein n=1 Tax=Chitinophaga niastensis TaxID=536980 RepID=A0A2P8HFF7_CHINA|nr:lipopolysaccharide biosynthesis protein [Chitinophaga niastensis]PSL44950.1 O-antigen/teichoic acid export membrane protein [Chitinophaga niastensis]